MDKNDQVRSSGVVDWFDSGRGYGFITVEGRSEQAFVHWKDIEPDKRGFKTLFSGTKVTFVLELTPKGLKAALVEPVEK